MTAGLNDRDLTLRTTLVENEPTGPITDYFYDHRNRLTGVGTRETEEDPETVLVAYTYDVFDRRIVSFYPGDEQQEIPDRRELFVYDRDQVLLDFLDPDGEPETLMSLGCTSRRSRPPPRLPTVPAWSLDTSSFATAAPANSGKSASRTINIPFASVGSAQGVSRR